jgi:hypothetical protein
MKAFSVPILLLSGVLAARAGGGVQIETTTNNLVRVTINGQLFTEYHFDGSDCSRPYYYPLLGPGEAPMTRQWPMGPGEGEEHDHPHHRSLWYAHSKVNGIDFWNDKASGTNFVSADGASIVHRKFLETKSGEDAGVIRSTDDWLAKDGTVQCSDERTLTIYARPDNERIFDFDITLRAPADKPVVFGDDKDGAMAVRVAESMRLKKPDKSPGTGHIVESTGSRDEDTWGKRADWCDYYGPVEGKILGIAIFDHPSNPRHPTWWHVRDYGLFAANPWGIHYFENKKSEPKLGDMTVPAGQSVTFRYRFYLHEGDEVQAKVAEHYQAYSEGGKP